MRSALLTPLCLLCLLSPLPRCAPGAEDQAERRLLNTRLSDGFLEHYVADGFTVVYTTRATLRGSFLDGPFSVCTTNGVKIAQGNYRSGVLDGEIRLWHVNGKRGSVQHFDNGKLTGVVEYWGPSGDRLRTTCWVDGVKEGAEVYWDSRGRTNKVILWKAGRPASVGIWSNGIPQQSFTGKAADDYFRRKMREAGTPPVPKKE